MGLSMPTELEIHPGFSVEYDALKQALHTCRVVSSQGIKDINSRTAAFFIRKDRSWVCATSIDTSVSIDLPVTEVSKEATFLLDMARVENLLRILEAGKKYRICVESNYVEILEPNGWATTIPLIDSSLDIYHRLSLPEDILRVAEFPSVAVLPLESLANVMGVLKEFVSPNFCLRQVSLTYFGNGTVYAESSHTPALFTAAISPNFPKVALHYSDILSVAKFLRAFPVNGEVCVFRHGKHLIFVLPHLRAGIMVSAIDQETPEQYKKWGSVAESKVLAEFQNLPLSFFQRAASLLRVSLPEGYTLGRLQVVIGMDQISLIQKLPFDTEFRLVAKCKVVSGSPGQRLSEWDLLFFHPLWEAFPSDMISIKVLEGDSTWGEISFRDFKIKCLFQE